MSNNDQNLVFSTEHLEDGGGVRREESGIRQPEARGC